MKEIVFSVVVLFCFSFFTNAQELQKDKSVYLQGGIVNGGYQVASGVEKLFGKDYTHSILASINYQNLSRSIDAIPMIHNEQNLFLNIGYRKYVPISYKLSPHVGLSVLVGNQHSGYAESGVYTHFATNEFLYGVGAHTGIEYKLKTKPSLFITGRRIHV